MAEPKKQKLNEKSKGKTISYDSSFETEDFMHFSVLPSSSSSIFANNGIFENLSSESEMPEINLMPLDKV